MPWSNSDFPREMKRLSTQARRHAVSVANKALGGGVDERTAIAQGIAAADTRFSEGKEARKGNAERDLYLSQIPN